MPEGAFGVGEEAAAAADANHAQVIRAQLQVLPSGTAPSAPKRSRYGMLSVGSLRCTRTGPPPPAPALLPALHTHSAVRCDRWEAGRKANADEAGELAEGKHRGEREAALGYPTDVCIWNETKVRNYFPVLADDDARAPFSSLTKGRERGWKNTGTKNLPKY